MSHVSEGRGRFSRSAALDRDRADGQAGRRRRARPVRRDRRAGHRDRERERRGRASTSSRSPATTARRRSPPARSPAASSSARAARREKEILTSRLIDRPLRPLFPKGFRCETQVIATVLSHDKENDPDVLAIDRRVGRARSSPTFPFDGPIAGVRVGRIGGQLRRQPDERAARRERPGPDRRRQPRRAS